MLLSKRLADRQCRCIFHRNAGCALLIANVDGEAAASAFDDGGIAKQAGDARAINGRGHDQQPQVGPQGSLYVEGQGQAEIAVQRTFVELVEQDRADPVQFGVVEDHTGQDALRNHEHTRRRRGPRFHPHGIADRCADLLAEQLGHAPGSGARREPARLQQQDLAVRQPILSKQG